MTALFTSGLLLAQQILPCHVIAHTAWNIVHATNINADKKVELITNMLGNGCIKQCEDPSPAIQALTIEY